ALRSFVETFKKKYRWVPYMIGIVAVYLIFQTSVPLNTIQAGAIVIAIIIAFFFVMKYRKSPDEKDGQDGQLGTSTYFRVTDYRKHPVSVSLVLFTLIVLYYAWINPFGVMDDHQMMDRTNRYSVSLPEYSSFLVIVVFLSVFNYRIKSEKAHCFSCGMNCFFCYFIFFWYTNTCSCGMIYIE